MVRNRLPALRTRRTRRSPARLLKGVLDASLPSEKSRHVRERLNQSRQDERLYFQRDLSFRNAAASAPFAGSVFANRFGGYRPTYCS
jgi:hypothetical protein